MIKIYDNNTGNSIEFEKTIFPDKSSQFWKLNPIITGTTVTVFWQFENESEFLGIIQLGELLKNLKNTVELRMDNLIYSRQDKAVTNDLTFALYPFLKCVNLFYDKLATVDAHNPNAIKDMFLNYTNIIPNYRINAILKESQSDLVCFPDKGASKRGYSYDEEWYGAPVILDKDRDQETGNIKGLKFATKFKPDLTGYKICIIDDLCDGGGTFIAAAKLLKEQGAKAVYLYTTHGIYSKGKEILFANGIDRVFNYNGEVKSDLNG